MANEAELNSRLKAFALMLKFGHDLFNGKTLNDTAAMAVNNSRVLLNFRNGALFEFENKTAVILSQFGQVEVNPHARIAAVQKRFVENFKFSENPQIVTTKEGLPKELSLNDGIYLAVKLTPPASFKDSAVSFMWLLEYEKNVPDYAVNTVKLLGSSISEALYFQKYCKPQSWRVAGRIKKSKFYLLALLLLIAIMFVPITENVSAEFTLKAPEITASYAPFDGLIAKTFKPDGVTVKSGEVIAEYDASLLRYRLALAQSALKETETELAVERQNSFTDSEKLGNVKLLEAKCDTMRIAVKEAQWYLDHAEIKAGGFGILVLSNGNKEPLEGKAVHIGEKIFEVFGGTEMNVEIPVSEADSSLLSSKKLKIILFLHTAPEKGLLCRILEISSYPELTEQRTYCYKVTAQITDNPEALRYGMRGIAKIYGDKVSLGYYLFKNALIFFREM